MKLKILSLVIFSLYFFINPVASQNILIWKNVGESVLVSPETGNENTSDWDIRVALAANVHTFTQVTTLPEDLSDFNLIFVTLGFAIDCG